MLTSFHFQISSTLLIYCCIQIFVNPWPGHTLKYEHFELPSSKENPCYYCMKGLGSHINCPILHTWSFHFLSCTLSIIFTCLLTPTVQLITAGTKRREHSANMTWLANSNTRQTNYKHWALFRQAQFGSTSLSLWDNNQSHIIYQGLMWQITGRVNMTSISEYARCSISRTMYIMLRWLKWFSFLKDAMKILELLPHQFCLNQTCLSMTWIWTPIESADIHICEIWRDASGRTKS